MINSTPIFQAVIGLMTTLITIWFIQWMQCRITAQKQETLAFVVDMLVYAAEQLFGAGRGGAKLEYVAEKLRERGYKVDFCQIESAVLKMIAYGAENSKFIIDIPGLLENTKEDAQDETNT